MFGGTLKRLLFLTCSRYCFIFFPFPFLLFYFASASIILAPFGNQSLICLILSVLSFMSICNFAYNIVNFCVNVHMHRIYATWFSVYEGLWVLKCDWLV